MKSNFLTFAAKLLLSAYIAFVIVYFLHDFTHNIFGCKLEILITEWWRCTELHAVTSGFLFLLTFVGLASLFFKNEISNND